LPFCQPSVVELAGRLSDPLKISGPHVKRTLYRAAAGLLPASVLNRPKQPFTLPIAAMLRPGNPLWDTCQQALNPADLRADGQLNPQAVAAALERQATNSDPATALLLWSLMIHQLWRVQFHHQASRWSERVPA
jgi:asparagine synthase (glutamine-hydrolysing)